MNADTLFDHALTSLPEAVGDLLRDGRDPQEFVFAAFDGSSELGKALIASDLTDEGAVGSDARAEVERLVLEASSRGEELVVSMMVTREVLARILATSKVTGPTGVAVRLWLDSPLHAGQFRVVAIAGEQVRAATVDATADQDEAPQSSSLLN